MKVSDFDSTLNQCGFFYLNEFAHGTGIWSQPENKYYIIAQCEGNPKIMFIVSAESENEAIELFDFHSIGFNILDKEQIQKIIRSLDIYETP